MKTIGIVGGGASGALAAWHCWTELQKNVQILIFEPAEKLGRGNAYAHEYDDYILNVPANNMGLDPHASDDFEKWILQYHPTVAKSRDWPFVPRHYFAAYLDHHLAQIPATHLQHIRDKATKISTLGRHYQIHTGHHHAHLCDYLIIATGYRTEPVIPYRPQLSDLQHKIFTSENYHKNDFSQACGRVLIVGSGLTAIDIWRKLKKNENLKFTFFSRRGFFPLEQDLSPPQIRFPTLYGMTPLQILQVIRSIQSAHKISWVTIANQIRPQIQKIWTCWTETEKRQFLKYLRPYWDVIRHRMPSSVFANLQQDLANKNVEIRSGKITHINVLNEKFIIEYRPRKQTSQEKFDIDHIIYATGLPVNHELCDHGQTIAGLSVCAHGMGYINKSAPRLWIVGPASKGMFWENIAIPDIREQTQQIAKDIATTDTIQNLRAEIFWVHPHAAKENYWVHLKKSASFGLFLHKSMWCAFVHAIFPFLYTDRISSCIRDLSCVLTKRRKRATHEKKIKPSKTPVVDFVYK